MYKIQVDHTDYPGFLDCDVCAQPHSGNEGTRRPAARIVCLEGREGGVLIFSNPSSNATIPARVAQIEIPFPFFYCFFLHEFQSQCTKSHFPASKKGKSQLPFYPFATLSFRKKIGGACDTETNVLGETPSNGTYGSLSRAHRYLTYGGSGVKLKRA